MSTMDTSSSDEEINSAEQESQGRPRISRRRNENVVARSRGTRSNRSQQEEELQKLKEKLEEMKRRYEESKRLNDEAESLLEQSMKNWADQLRKN